MSSPSTLASPAPLASALWADASSRVYALIDGCAVPGLPARLAAADVLGFDCLARGALEADAAARAAYLVDLRDASPFTGWLLHGAATECPGWGVLLVSAQTLLPLRQHCRSLSEVMLPDGRQRAWRWYDPQVLQVLLPGLSPGQLDDLFGPGLALVVPAPGGWTWHTLEQGLLVSATRAAT